MNITACLACRYATHVFISTAARDDAQFDEREAQRALIPPLVYVEQDVDVCSLPMRRPRTPGMKARGENLVAALRKGVEASGIFRRHTWGILHRQTSRPD